MAHGLDDLTFGNSAADAQDHRARPSLIKLRRTVHDFESRFQDPKCVRRKKRPALLVVVPARRSNGTPRIVATASATTRTYPGSLRFPRCGTGARNGASVSMRRRSSGIVRTAARKASALRKVAIPEMERCRPRSR